MNRLSLCNDIYSLLPENSDLKSSIDLILGVFEITKIFVFFALILSVITLICYAASILFIKELLLKRNFKIMLGALFSGLSITGAIYLLISWSAILQLGMDTFLSLTKNISLLIDFANIAWYIEFWYSSTPYEGIFISSGPGYSWYLIIIAAIFGLATVGLTIKENYPLIENK